MCSTKIWKCIFTCNIKRNIEITSRLVIMNWIRTRDFRDTGALLYQLRFEATTWERGQFVEFISPARVFAPNVWLHSSVGTASHRYRGGHGFESRWSPDFFRLLLSNYLKWKIYCDDLSLLWSTTAVHIWIISYILHAMENLFAFSRSF